MKKINGMLRITLIFITLLCATAAFAQDVPLPPKPGQGTGDKAPATEVPFGTGFDLLVLLGGGLVVKYIQDTKKKKSYE